MSAIVADQQLPGPPIAPGMEIQDKPISMFRRGLSVFVENKLALFSLVVLVAIVLFAFVGPHLYYTDFSLNLDAITQPPSAAHPLGTDQDGIDQLGRLMQGAQASLEVGLAAGVIAAIVGSFYGAISGYIGGWLDALMMRIIDAMFSLPLIFLLIFVSAIYGNSKTVLIMAIGLTSWFANARLSRGESLTIKVRDYVAACKMMGGSTRRIIVRHVMPNTIGTTIVNTTFSIADAIFALSTLSYIGLGLVAPHDDLGGMLDIGTGYASNGWNAYWWMIYPPAFLIIVTILCFNVIGDALRDAFETRLQKR
jgi:peptide/nickel transport system permease protein